jgi:ppGpp synthetase/RelA/SpoT-type nucleotidyltranferase
MTISTGNQEPLSAVQVEEQYIATRALADRMLEGVRVQLLRLFNDNDVTLAVPIESRVKHISSIVEKVERKSIILHSIFDVDDLVGLRIILLFESDVQKVCDLIEGNLSVISKTASLERLDTNSFGYASEHFTIKLPSTWLNVPSYRGLDSVRAEIQVRTLAQHMWAAASHKLQYKHEASVPIPLRRALSRASALLEIVDKEFSRVLDERRNYLDDISTIAPDEPLNVDIISSVLSSKLPLANKQDGERYEEILSELFVEGIATRKQLEDFIDAYLIRAVREDFEQAESVMRDPEDYDDNHRARAKQGVYFTHPGLIRVALSYLREERPKPDVDDDLPL